MTSPLDTGRVRIQLTCTGEKVSAVQIKSDRPDVSKILRGRTTEQALQLISLLFSLCGQAQTTAARLALAAAQGDESPPQLDTSVQREALREHLWRCLLDLPPLLGDEPMQQKFISAAKWIAEDRREELHLLLTSPPIESLRLCLQQSATAPRTFRLLPTLDAHTSLTEWARLHADFCRQPTWRGAAAETGAGARKQQHNDAASSFFSTRWLARFDELLEWAKGEESIGYVGTASAVSVAPGIGRSTIESARGLLMHEVALDGGHIAEYLIVAPTEWNFHPQGALHNQLLGQDAQNHDLLQQHVARLVATLDPCVPWELEWA